MNVYVDERIRAEEESYLNSLGNVIKIPKQNYVYEEISSHCDIFVSKIVDELICAPSVYDLFSNSKINVIRGNKDPGQLYPEDVLYNVCNIGNLVIGNFLYTDDVVLKEIEKKRFEKSEC